MKEEALFTYDSISYTETDILCIGDKLARFWKGRYIGHAFSVKQARIRFNCKRKKTKFTIELPFSHLQKYLGNEVLE